MLQRRFLLPVASLLLFAGFAQAQSALLDLPRKSQNAQVAQTIGITEVTVKYSRPLVGGRKSGVASCPMEKSGAPEPMRTRSSPLPIPSPSRASRSTKAPTACS